MRKKIKCGSWHSVLNSAMWMEGDNSFIVCLTASFKERKEKNSCPAGVHIFLTPESSVNSGPNV